MEETKIKLKLLIDTHGKRVLFAEASKDFVDFLFGILSLPVGTLISLLRYQNMVGSIANLYTSIHNLNQSYLQPNQNKDELLNPASGSVPLLQLIGAPTEKRPGSWRRSLSGSYATGYDHSYAIGKRSFSLASSGCTPAIGEGGIVQGVVNYMVMDDLVVTPYSPISSITLLNKFNVTNIGALEEKVVHFGQIQAVKLLNASLQSKKVLTDVFLNGI